MKNKHRDLILAGDEPKLELSDMIVDSAKNSFLPPLDYAWGNTHCLQAADRRFFLLTLAAAASIFILGLWKWSADKQDYKTAMFARRI